MKNIHTISTSARLILAAVLLSAISVLALSAPTHAQSDGYSYTVGDGDGVTNLILDYAEANDKEISPARAYRIAQDNGQQFLDNNLTVESDLPYTEGIGAFDEPGITIAAADNQQLFDDIETAVNDSPAASDDEVTVPDEEPATDDSSDSQTEEDQTATDDAEESSDQSDDETDDDDEASDEAAATDDEGEDEDSSDDNVWPWIIGIAAVLGGLYYINQSREE